MVEEEPEGDREEGSRDPGAPEAQVRERLSDEAQERASAGQVLGTGARLRFAEVFFKYFFLLVESY